VGVFVVTTELPPEPVMPFGCAKVEAVGVNSIRVHTCIEFRCEVGFRAGIHNADPLHPIFTPWVAVVNFFRLYIPVYVYHYDLLANVFMYLAFHFWDQWIAGDFDFMLA
jgi:hypothetical protein